MASPEILAAITAWRREDEPDKKRELFNELLASRAFAMPAVEDWESYAGLYPDSAGDENFLPKLLQKAEFLETKQPSVAESLEEGEDRCEGTEDFELTPTQRFIHKFLSPYTPYKGALLYHGVGVGKTCAAVVVCESYLEQFPDRQAIIIAPRNIQSGFFRNIFDINQVIWGDGETKPNRHRGCTGNIYLQLTNSLYDRKEDREKLELKVQAVIRQRYKFYGYTSFYKEILEKQAKLNLENKPPAAAEEALRKMLQVEYGNRVMVIDEAHNLRDALDEDDQDEVDDPSEGAKKSSQEGKKLTPFLKKIFNNVDNLKLLLMTATPMYNSYVEIVFLLNLLLMNDKQPLLQTKDIFNVNEDRFEIQGPELLGAIANQYVSYMRGENPLTFPLRIEPQAPSRITVWPRVSVLRRAIPPDEQTACVKLGCVGASFPPEIEKLYETYSDTTSLEGLPYTILDQIVSAGNFIYPGDAESDIRDRIQKEGFKTTFGEMDDEGQFSCQSTDGDASWLRQDVLPKVSPKCAVLINRLNNCRGVAFVYSRFVSNGALSIALALEANGYLPWNLGGRGLLKEGNQTGRGRKCALCPLYEVGHGVQPADGLTKTPEHGFKQAYYVLLTGDKDLSPNNAKSIRAERDDRNVRGEQLKVIIGSQVAGEGLDLKFIREIFVFDSWYHLNKLEQIVGRGIRNCSHKDLDPEFRNCTITLLVNQYQNRASAIKETIDMYSYRFALQKAIKMGNVTRVLKQYALDCALNKEAILVKGLPPLTFIVDSQGKRRENVNRNDMPLTPLCDWGECEYECRAAGMEEALELDPSAIDYSTYDEYAARYEKTKLQRYLVNFFETNNQAFATFEDIQRAFPIPAPILASLLYEIVNDPDFLLEPGQGMKGKLIYRDRYFFYQPLQITDTRIPTAIRLAQIPIGRDSYAPVKKEVVEPAEVIPGAEDSEGLWLAVQDWAEAIREGIADEMLIPQNIVNEVGSLRISAGILKSQKEKLDILLWIYRYGLFSDTGEKNPDALNRYADCVMEFFWDEYITGGTKEALLREAESGDLLHDLVAKDSFWDVEGTEYVRFVNPDTNDLQYLNATKEEQRILGKMVDPLTERPLDQKTTGFLYGFVLFNPKKKQLVFKRAEPPLSGGKMPRGTECANNSEVSKEINNLKKLTTLMRSMKHPVNLGFTAAILGEYPISNSIRVCTVLDMALRYMDKANIAGKRWFYRPLEAKLYKHPLR